MIGVVYPFCIMPIMNFDKNANSMNGYGFTTFCLIVGRQAEFAFFGALTSVDALFLWEVLLENDVRRLYDDKGIRERSLL